MITKPTTPREREVFTLTFHGHSAKQVGSIIGLSQGGVQSNLLSLYRKTNTHNIRECAAYLRAINKIDANGGWL